ncbi:MAG: hydroxyacid dehydrogenase [Microvirga sp.]|nr:hydroxyacid dehydrogenase [Microvirga sp.]
MIDCVITQPICESGVGLLRDAGLKVFEAPTASVDAMRGPLATARAVITRNWGFSAAAIAAAPMLRVIGSHGTGIDAIDLASARARGIVVVNTPGTNSISVAEHVLGLMLACARSTLTADRAMRVGDHGFRTTSAGVELSGRRLGLVGYGRIARHVAHLARAFGMQVHVLSRHAAAEDIARDGAIKADDLGRLLAISDILSLHGLPDGAHVIGAAELAMLPRGAILINTARGTLLDEAALIAALECGYLRAAGLDVFRLEPLPAESPLLRCRRLIVSPHIGGATAEALERTGLEVARKVLSALAECERP